MEVLPYIQGVMWRFTTIFSVLWKFDPISSLLWRFDPTFLSGGFTQCPEHFVLGIKSRLIYQNVLCRFNPVSRVIC